MVSSRRAVDVDYLDNYGFAGRMAVVFGPGTPNASGGTGLPKNLRSAPTGNEIVFGTKSPKLTDEVPPLALGVSTMVEVPVMVSTQTLALSDVPWGVFRVSVRLGPTAEQEGNAPDGGKTRKFT